MLAIAAVVPIFFFFIYSFLFIPLFIKGLLKFVLLVIGSIGNTIMIIRIIFLIFNNCFIIFIILNTVLTIIGRAGVIIIINRSVFNFNFFISIFSFNIGDYYITIEFFSIG